MGRVGPLGSTGVPGGTHPPARPARPRSGHWLEQIRALGPETDHQRIVFLGTCCEFPFDTTRALELALFRNFCVPSISALLDRTGEFRNRAQKRYDDTDLIVGELMERGCDSERGRRALRRMNVRCATIG